LRTSSCACVHAPEPWPAHPRQHAPCAGCSRLPLVHVADPVGRHTQLVDALGLSTVMQQGQTLSAARQRKEREAAGRYVWRASSSARLRCAVACFCAHSSAVSCGLLPRTRPRVRTGGPLCSSLPRTLTAHTWARATLCEARMHTLRRQGKRSNRFRRSGDMSFRCKWSVLRDGRVAGAFAAALAGPAGALEAGVVARAVGRGAAAAPSAGCTQERSKDECNALSACRVVRNAPGLPSDRSAAAAAQISGYTVRAGRQQGVISTFRCRPATMSHLPSHTRVRLQRVCAHASDCNVCVCARAK
jgi:hypothetical protein